MDVGQDLVIWTKHFTKFVSYTQTDTGGSTAPGGGGGGSPRHQNRLSPKPDRQRLNQVRVEPSALEMKRLSTYRLML
ncbi:MAG: hypothetical protein ACOX4Q_05250 [Syntrophomonadales bacterium]